MSVSGSLSNPFHGSIMEDPWKAATVDVPSIHGPIFQQCCQAVEVVRSNGTSAGLVIHQQFPA